MAYVGWHIGPENAAERILIGNMEKEGLLMGETEKRYLETAIADDDIVYGATQIFDALSDFTRFQILCALRIQDRSVGELQEFCHVSQSAISHQLRLLKDRGIVASKRDGQRMVYSLDDDHVATLIEVGLEHAGHYRCEGDDGEDA